MMHRVEFEEWYATIVNGDIDGMLNIDPQSLIKTYADSITNAMYLQFCTIKNLEDEIDDEREMREYAENKITEVERKAKIDRSINNHLMHHLKCANFDIKYEQLSRFKMLMRRDDLTVADVLPEVIKWAEDENKEVAARAVEHYDDYLSSFACSGYEFAAMIRSGDFDVEY